MVEQIMYLAIGFLIAMLLALMIAPLVHNRAVRLTTKRLEAATPLSMAEIQADKDQLRAEFAMSARRLEMSVDTLKNRTTSQLAEIGKKTDAINRLKTELVEKKDAIFKLEESHKAIEERLRTTEAEAAATKQELAATQATLTAKQAELARTSNELAQRSTLADTRQVELVAARTQIEELRARLGDTEKEYATTQSRLDAQRGQSAATGRELDEARGRIESLSQRIAELDRQLVLQVKEAETLGGRIRELEKQLAAREEKLAASETENKQLRAASQAALSTVGELRNDLDATRAKSPEAARMHKEKVALEEQLRQARDDRAKTQRELDALKQQAESSWESERMENALLRERINDIAAEVAKLAITLEGPDSPIQAMLAQPEPQAKGKPAKPGKPANGTKASDPAVAPAVLGGTLAERIRALQSQASRARKIG